MDAKEAIKFLQDNLDARPASEGYLGVSFWRTELEEVIKSLREAVEWQPTGAMIPLTERLPDPDVHERVIIYTMNDSFMGEQFFDVLADDITYARFCNPDEYEGSEVAMAATHWMPLPEVE